MEVDGVRWVAPTTLLVSLVEMTDEEHESNGGEVAALQWDSWAGQPGVDPQGLTTTRMGYNALGVSCKQTPAAAHQLDSNGTAFLGPCTLHLCSGAASPGAVTSPFVTHKCTLKEYTCHDMTCH
jgi:hypothetical protein